MFPRPCSQHSEHAALSVYCSHGVRPSAQELWRDFLRDFVIEVVRRPVVAVGNSIGGYISASLAGDYPALVSGEHCILD